MHLSSFVTQNHIEVSGSSESGLCPGGSSSNKLLCNNATANTVIAEYTNDIYVEVPLKHNMELESITVKAV